MKKNYIQPITKCVDLELENMIAQSIKLGEGDGDHDASSNERYLFDDADESEIW